MFKFGFIFPGQGAQHLHMLREHYLYSQIVRETFQQASDVLSTDLWSIISGNNKPYLDSTQITQPAVLTASIALWRLWFQRGGNIPSIIAGHSLGEYSALVCAGVLDFEQALRLVKTRGEYMTSAVAGKQTRMVAVLGMEKQIVVDICQRITHENQHLGLVSAINFNSPAQTVITGDSSAVSYAENVLKQNGASRILPLAVSVPSHCYLMKPAAEKLRALLENTRFNPPVIDLVNNVDVKRESNVQRIQSALVRQMYCPVRWVEIINHIEQNHLASILVELGPNNILTGLVKRISTKFERFSTCEPALFDKAFTAINK